MIIIQHLLTSKSVQYMLTSTFFTKHFITCFNVYQWGFLALTRSHTNPWSITPNLVEYEAPIWTRSISTSVATVPRLGINRIQNLSRVLRMHISIGWLFLSWQEFQQIIAPWWQWPRIRLDRNLVCELLLPSSTYVQSFGSIALSCFSKMATWQPYL
jgi:hypothetical protein